MASQFSVALLPLFLRETEGCVSEPQGCFFSPWAAHPLTRGFEKFTLLPKANPSAMQKGRGEQSSLIPPLQEDGTGLPQLMALPQDMAMGQKSKQGEGPVQLLLSKKYEGCSFLEGDVLHSR